MHRSLPGSTEDKDLLLNIEQEGEATLGKARKKGFIFSIRVHIKRYSLLDVNLKTTFTFLNTFHQSLAQIFVINVDNLWRTTLHRSKWSNV